MRFLARCTLLPVVATLVVAACGGRADSTGAGSSAGADDGGTETPPVCTGICSESACVAGARQTGQGHCASGQWECETAPCVDDAGSCDGTVIPVCDQGHLGSGCCPAGAPCFAPEPFCDLGGGTCHTGPCADAGPCDSLDAGTGGQDCATDSG